MSSDDVTVREDSAIPFAIVPKTQQQRLKIARAVLGPPTGFDRGRLLQLREDICGIGLTFVSFVLLLVFFQSSISVCGNVDPELMKTLNEVFEIQSLLDAFVEVIEQNIGLTLEEMVKRLLRIPSLYAIVAILKVMPQHFPIDIDSMLIFFQCDCIRHSPTKAKRRFAANLMSSNS
jgi:hypothetical protein